jgi:hypothetical protein
MYDTKAAGPCERAQRLLWINLINDERKRTMRKIAQVLALMLALSAPVTAGIMQCPVTTPTPDAQEPTTGGDIQNSAAGSLTQIALDLLAILPSLL